MLAVGDANGNLHIFDLPRNLWKPLPNEKAVVRQFLDRELKKVSQRDPRRHIASIGRATLATRLPRSAAAKAIVVLLGQVDYTSKRLEFRKEEAELIEKEKEDAAAAGAPAGNPIHPWLAI